MNRTPFHELHLAAGGRMIDFDGWELPVQYTSIIGEHKATRAGAGLFDVSHMTRVRITGEGTRDLLAAATANDVDRLADGQAQYSFLLDDDANIRDDIIVYRGTADRWYIVANAGKRGVVADALDTVPGREACAAIVEDLSDEWCMFALQGPASLQIAAKILPDLGSLPYFGLRELTVDGHAVVVVRTGYTGERGVEIMGPAPALLALWTKAAASGAVPVGLGARDTLRLEMGYPLWGNDLVGLTPLDAGLMWAVRKSIAGFTGAAALAAQKASGAAPRLVGFKLTEKGVPRHGYPVTVNGADAGLVASGCWSPTLELGVGLALLDKPLPPGAVLGVRVRANVLGAEAVKPPFVPARAKD